MRLRPQHHIRIRVSGFNDSFIDIMDAFYRLLASAKGRYILECKSGNCSSFIELPSQEYQVLVSAPGLISMIKLDTETSAEGGLLPPPRGNELLWCLLSDTQYRQHRSYTRNEIVVGYCNDITVTLDENALLRHLLIVGSTGSGKSHTAARIAACAHNLGFQSIILDWHGEYEYLLRSQGIRDYVILSYPNLPPVALTASNIPLEVSISVLERTLGLSQFQSSILAAFLILSTTQDANLAKGLLNSLTSHINSNELSDIASILNQGNTISDLVYVIAKIFNKYRDEFSRAEQEIWLALIRRLNLLAASRYASLFIIKDSGYLTDYFLGGAGPIVIRLSDILSLRIRKLYAIYLINMLYSQAISNRLSKKLLVVIEEGHNVLENGTISELVAETRKYGIGFLVVVHTPRLLPELSEANFNTIIAHRITSINDRTIVARAIGLDDDYLLAQLEPGDVFIRKPGTKTPFLTKIALEKPCLI